MPRKAKPLPLPLIDPASRPVPGIRAMLIRRAKLKYPELSESQIARYVGCSPSNVHQVLQSFLACRPTRMRLPI
jgi:AraC-like DNA-binding protein